MSDSLNLVALVTEMDKPLIPPLERVVIFTKILGHICDLEPQQLPENSFVPGPCPPSDLDLDEGLADESIDFLGLYEPAKCLVTLQVCRIRNIAFRHGFHIEDVIKVVLIHELAHFVTHLGMSKCQLYWEGFCDAKSETLEDFAQEATHLVLRVAGYDHLVHVFDSLSHLCPPKYDIWRETWERQLKNKDKLDAVLNEFRGRILEQRPDFGTDVMVMEEGDFEL
jgi:hypothetical protein